MAEKIAGKIHHLSVFGLLKYWGDFRSGLEIGIDIQQIGMDRVKVTC